MDTANRCIRGSLSVQDKMTMSAYHLSGPKQAFYDIRIALGEFPWRTLGRSGNMIGCGHLVSDVEFGQFSKIIHGFVGARSIIRGLRITRRPGRTLESLAS